MDTSEISLIDLFVTADHVILSRDQSSVWCCRRSGELLLGSEFDASHVESTSLGTVWGCIGKIRFFTDGEWKLLLITQASCVGTLPQGSKVYCVDKITIIPLTTEPSVEIVGLEASETFEKSAVFISLPGLGVELNDMATGSGSSTGRPSSPTFKEKFMSFVTESEKPKELKDREKVEKRLTEALLWMFNDSRSFYFSTDFDLTQNLQRKTEQSSKKHLPLWKTVDERFFWNKWMLTDLIENYQGDISDQWILPLIQGYVEIRQIPITTENTPDILQPGWNVKYAEKRMSLTSDIDFGLTPSFDLALKEQDSLNTIQSELSGSGYETDSESDGDSDQQEDIDKLMMRDMNETDQEVMMERGRVSEAPTCTQRFDQACAETSRTKYKRSEKEQEDAMTPEILPSKASNVTIVIDDNCQAEGERPVPSLSSLCEDLLKDHLGDQTNRPTSNRLRPESDLSNFESDYFAGSSARTSEEEGWVSVRNEGVLSESSEGAEESPLPTFTLAIVSRRSRYRAGTRYRRRGVDETGNVANNVETEMLVQCGAHVVSYVIVRGSVPVYWTQPGYKYRPLPIIESNDEDTQEAFQRHFNTQLNLYQEMVVVNLVKQSGKEKVLSDAYEKHILKMNNQKITYIVFDFHHHFKTSQSTALKHLLRKTQDITRKMRFCWLDTDQSAPDDSDTSGSVLCRQESVYRVNCMDCLDRTNVTQSVFARDVLQSALQKLGVIPFEDRLEGSMLTSFKEMWGNNGDIVSKQYTGTVAMKGDITRYGERKLSGLMKDGYNSAQRYYMNIFRDAYRQVLIDLMQGSSPVEAFSSLPSSMQGTDEIDDVHTELVQVTPTLSPPMFEVGPEEQLPMSVLDREEAVMDIVQHCKNEVFPNKSLHLQAWALMEAAGHSLVSLSTKEELCVLIQCRENSQLTFVNYSMEVEQIVCLLRIPMDQITKIVIGPLGMYQLRSSRRLHMRIYYSFEDTTHYLTLRTVSSSPPEDDKAVLLSIADALSFLQPDIQVAEHKLPKKKSPEHNGVVYLMVPNSFVKSLDEQQSNEISSEGHVTCAVTTELPRVPSNESFTSDTKYAESEQSIGYEKPLNARCRSCDDILSATTLSPTVPMVIVSHPLNPTGSLNTANGLRQSNPGSRRRETIEDSGTMKRASSDTMLSSIEEDTMEERFTKFTGRLFQNLLKVGKSLKQRTSPTKHKIPVDDLEPQIRVETETETERKQTNEDSDSKWPKKLQHRFRAKAGGSGRTTPQNEPSEEEVVKNEKRAQSKSKIIIV